MHPEIFLLVYIELKMTVKQPLFTSIGLISGRPFQIGRPLYGILIMIINFNGGLQSLTDCLVLILLLD